MRLVNLRVTRNEREVMPLTVPSWEVDVVRAVHGPEQVEVMGEIEDAREYPEAGQEYDRLSRRYGVDRDENGQGGPFVAQVYGGNAHQRLAQLIEIERQREVSKTLKLKK